MTYLKVYLNRRDDPGVPWRVRYMILFNIAFTGDYQLLAYVSLLVSFTLGDSLSPTMYRPKVRGWNKAVYSPQPSGVALYGCFW